MPLVSRSTLERPALPIARPTLQQARQPAAAQLARCMTKPSPLVQQLSARGRSSLTVEQPRAQTAQSVRLLQPAPRLLSRPVRLRRAAGVTWQPQTQTQAVSGRREVSVALFFRYVCRCCRACKAAVIRTYWTVKVAVLLVTDWALDVVFFEPELSAACARTE